ncbi:MAG TPA: hypothetical protein P5572_01590 [Phycisphaerae bacterium]|nr:hypothetical protein [Phycisphaerales bacterium]HRX83692.1 hypothetical protein [Phycisphaerae bacterium]
MRLDELRETLRRTPFQPVRVHLTGGRSLDIRHPEFSGLTRHSLFIGVPAGDDAPDRMVQCDLLHVVSIAPIDGESS